MKPSGIFPSYIQKDFFLLNYQFKMTRHITRLINKKVMFASS